MSQLIGASPAIQALREEVELIAHSEAKVLITGESGVGKEVLAKLVYQRGRRRHAKLLTLNCAGLSESLLESELFGHTKGSFTGADRDKPGLLDLADNGTAFLDEVGEMSARMQSLLLRFMETGEIQPVGGITAPRHVNVRIIAATNRSLQEQVQAGSFRSDLYYRLNVIHLTIPPLRERPEDIVPLLTHFLMTLSEHHRVAKPELAASTVERLVAYAWPGNVRELKNVSEQLVVRRGGKLVNPGDLPPALGVTAPKFAVAATAAVQQSTPVADQLFDKMVVDGESFWSAVYPIFIRRDLTRDNLRQVVQKGLRQTRGNYKLLVNLFNMDDQDYRRFLTFLRKHHCQVPFWEFRTAALKSRREAQNVSRAS
ncbi:MAG: sigma 54-interacting transcriptional regulator [Vicinamibacterales bacterium]